jgi:surface antigen
MGAMSSKGSLMSNVPWLDRAVLGSIAALALAAAVAPADAQVWSGVLKDTPAEKFNDEDMRLFNEASRKALNDAAVGETVRWENPATSSRGELKVLKTFTWKDQPCRQIRMHNEARARKATSTLDLCRVSDQWRMVSPTELKQK